MFMGSRSHPTPPPPKSPTLFGRSRSGASRFSLLTTSENLLTSPNANIVTASAAGRSALSAARSRSTTKSRGRSDRDAPLPHNSQKKVYSQENRESLTSIFGGSQKPAGSQAADAISNQRRPTSSGGGPAVASPAAATPSAWALSPGRSLGSSEVAESGDRARKKSGGGRGVLSFFRQKKAPSPREEAAHQLRDLYSRLLQWRFVNARAQAAARAGKSATERKLFSVWARVRELRKLVAAKRVLVQRVRHQMKLAAVLGPQLRLLREWDDGAGRKNADAVARCTGLLQAACTALPLAEGARVGASLKVDVASLHASISTATDIIEGIKTTITKYYHKASDASSFMKELVETLKLEKKGLEELAKVARTVAILEMQETSLRAQLVQDAKKLPPPPQTHQNKPLHREVVVTILASVAGKG